MNQQPGKILLLNGAPRSGKSSIVKGVLERFPGQWLNLGVDNYMKTLSPLLQPGIGLRPGGEAPEKEEAVLRMYRALYRSIAAHSREGFCVAADFGHHENYASIENVFSSCLSLLEGLPVYLVGIYCPLEEILRRREATGYAARDSEGNPLPPILRWQKEVHRNKKYDLILDTSRLSPEECLEQVEKLLAFPPAGKNRAETVPPEE